MPPADVPALRLWRRRGRGACMHGAALDLRPAPAVMIKEPRPDLELGAQASCGVASQSNTTGQCISAVDEAPLGVRHAQQDTALTRALPPLMYRHIGQSIPAKSMSRSGASGAVGLHFPYHRKGTNDHQLQGYAYGLAVASIAKLIYRFLFFRGPLQRGMAEQKTTVLYIWLLRCFHVLIGETCAPLCGPTVQPLRLPSAQQEA